MFTLTSSSSLNIDLLAGQRFGARLQNTSGSEGSSKLSGTSPSAAVPEPLTILGVGTALSFGALFKRELAKKQRNKATA